MFRRKRENSRGKSLRMLRITIDPFVYGDYTFAMHLYVNFPAFITPYVFRGLPIRWYSIMYLVAFGITYLIFNNQIKKKVIKINEDDTFSLFIYAIGFLLLGARLGSVIIYDSERWYYLTRPWLIFWPFRNGSFVGLPGMSYHGGVVGFVVGVILFCKSTQRREKKAKAEILKLYGAKKYLKKQHEAPASYTFFQIADQLLLGVPLGYTFGRLGNFINGELYGRVTGSSFGMIFPDATRFSTSESWVAELATKLGFEFTPGSFINLPRHPSQLYEALFEGIILFLVLWFVVRPIALKRKPGLITGMYLALYGLVRFVIEYFREPDENLGFIIKLGKHDGPIALFESVGNISMGQILCLLMIISGLLIIFLTNKEGKNDSKSEN